MESRLFSSIRKLNAGVFNIPVFGWNSLEMQRLLAELKISENYLNRLKLAFSWGGDVL